MPRVPIDRVAEIIVDVADAVIMPRWRNLAAHEIGTKSRPDDLVTIADREAEEALSQRLADILPGAHVVGEEAVSADGAVLELLRSSEPVWVIDPIDGTRKFSEGRPEFDVLVALVQDGRGLAGWIYSPAKRALILGEAGGGVRRRVEGQAPQILKRRAAGPLRELEGILSPRPFLSRGLADPAAVRDRFRSFSPPVCAGHNYARLLMGESDFLINFSALAWDHLAGLALATEAGFHHARHDGAAYDPLDPRGGLLVAPGETSWHEIRESLLRPA